MEQYMNFNNKMMTKSKYLFHLEDYSLFCKITLRTWKSLKLDKKYT